MNTEKKKLIVVGGGFAGIEVAKKLGKEKSLDITLVTKSDFFEYLPALYKLVTGALAIEVCVPYKEIFNKTNVKVIKGEYVSFDKDKKEILLTDGSVMAYDYLVLAIGSEVNYFNIPGIEQYAFPFKSAQQALNLKQHFCDLLQQSKDVSKDELVKRFHVTVVGGGPSGVELAGDITTYLRKQTKRYHIDPSFVTVDLIESNNRVLKTLPEKVSRLVENRLRKLKVNIYTNRTLQEQELMEVKASGMTLDGATVIWTAGIKLHTNLSTLDLTERKLVNVEQDFSLKGTQDVFVIGDGANALGAGLAQGAIAHGGYVASLIKAKIANKKVPPYKGKVLGYALPVGHNWAVFTHKNLTISGFLPWILRSAIDFHYFTTIVPLSYVFDVFKQGAKYRK